MVELVNPITAIFYLTLVPCYIVSQDYFQNFCPFENLSNSAKPA